MPQADIHFTHIWRHYINIFSVIYIQNYRGNYNLWKVPWTAINFISRLKLSLPELCYVNSFTTDCNKLIFLLAEMMLHKPWISRRSVWYSKHKPKRAKYGGILVNIRCLCLWRVSETPKESVPFPSSYALTIFSCLSYMKWNLPALGHYTVLVQDQCEMFARSKTSSFV
jgi:hypothetical protein